jgi:hypothetical protein
MNSLCTCYAPVTRTVSSILRDYAARQYAVSFLVAAGPISTDASVLVYYSPALGLNVAVKRYDATMLAAIQAANAGEALSFQVPAGCDVIVEVSAGSTNPLELQVLIG